MLEAYAKWTEEQFEARRRKQRGPNPKKSLPGARNPFFGKKHTEETLRRLKASIDPKQRAAVAAGNTNVRGRSWFNDGTRSFMLLAEKAALLGLKPGRAEGMCWFKDSQHTYRLGEEEGKRRGLARGRLASRIA
jgi:hypothetical protein